MAIYSLIGLFIKSFEVIVKSVVIFLATYLDSEILKENNTSHPPSCFIIVNFNDVTTWVDSIKPALNYLNFNEIFLNSSHLT